MIEVISCAASLSLCYTATCYGISGCIGSCWPMGDSKCKASTLHIQAEQTQIQWKQPLLVCCFHDVYNIMARRICINRHQSQFLHANLMYRILLPVHLLNVTLYTNFVHAVDEQADDNLYHHRAPWWHCVPLMQLLEQRTKLQCQVGAVTLAFYRSFFIQAVTGYKGWKLSLILVFLDHFLAKL